MRIEQNNLKRYDVIGIDDQNGKKAGIAGYQCKFIGWLAKLFCKAVAVKTDNGTIYLNRKSFANWYSRVAPKPEGMDKKKLGDSEFVKTAIEQLVQLKKHVDEPKENIQFQIKNCLEVSGNISDEEKTKDKSEIIPNLFLGRSDQKDFFDMVVFANGDANEKAVINSNSKNFLIGEDTLSINDLIAVLFFINDALVNGKRVLIADREGRHRSACIAAAYLIKGYNVSVDEVAKFLMSKRPIVDLDTASEEETNPISYRDFLNSYLSYLGSFSK